MNATSPYLRQPIRTESEATAQIEAARDEARSGSTDATRRRWKDIAIERLVWAMDALDNAQGWLSSAELFMEIGGPLEDERRTIIDLISDIRGKIEELRR